MCLSEKSCGLDKWELGSCVRIGSAVIQLEREAPKGAPRPRAIHVPMASIFTMGWSTYNVPFVLPLLEGVAFPCIRKCNLSLIRHISYIMAMYYVLIYT